MIWSRGEDMTEQLCQGAPVVSEIEYDVIVVGSGGGALTGAALAAKAGLSTVVLEKTPLIGGTSAYSGGACWLPGSDVQQRAGIPDSTESARSTSTRSCRTPTRRRSRRSSRMHRSWSPSWRRDPGMEFEWLPFPEYYDAPGRVPFGRSIQPTNIKRADLPLEVGELVRPPVERDRAGRRRPQHAQRRAVADRPAGRDRAPRGGTILTEHAVGELVTEHGRVVGRRGDVPRRPGQRARPPRRADRRGRLRGQRDDARANTRPGDVAWTMAPRGTNAGEPIRAAELLGAATDYSALGWFCPGLEHPDGSGSFTLGFRGGLMVDATGRRYANECLPYDRFGREMAKAPDRIPSWFVFDDREGGRLPAIAMPEGDPRPTSKPAPGCAPTPSRSWPPRSAYRRWR